MIPRMNITAVNVPPIFHVRLTRRDSGSIEFSLPEADGFERVDLLKHHALESIPHAFIENLPAHEFYQLSDPLLGKSIAGFAQRGDLISKYELRHWSHRGRGDPRHVVKEVR